MKWMLWCVLCLCVFSINYVTCYPDGAPEKACFIMVPRHTHPATRRPVRPQREAPPYNVTVSRTTFSPDRPVTVTIQGAPFKGFLIVAAEDGSKDWPTGIFHSYSKRVRTNYCSYRNDAATHSDGKWKTRASFEWYAPAHTAADFIQFIATVVTNRTTYWTDIRSVMLQPDPNMGETPEIGEGGIAEAGMLLGGAMGNGPGVDAWGYPTTPSFSMFGGGGAGAGSRGGAAGFGGGQGASGGGRGAAGGGRGAAGEFGRGRGGVAQSWSSSTAAYGYDAQGYGGQGFGDQGFGNQGFGNQGFGGQEFGRGQGFGQGRGGNANTGFGRRNGGAAAAGAGAGVTVGTTTPAEGAGEGTTAATPRPRTFNRAGGARRGNTGGSEATGTPAASNKNSNPSNWFMNWARQRGMFDPSMSRW